MVSSIAWLGTSAAAAAAAVLYFHLRRTGRGIPAAFFCLYFLLPFAAGGFHSHVSFAVSWILALYLIHISRKTGNFRFICNISSIAVISVVLGYFFAIFWAADRGMALFGISRFFPMLLLMLVYMQHSREERRYYLTLLPLSGALMTVLSCLFLLIPGAERYLTVYSRLTGFLQYPNTFAAFLLAGLIIRNREAACRKTEYLIDALLILGILLSGSRTCFVLLVVTLIGIALIRKKLRPLLILGSFLLCSLLISMLAANSEMLHDADRFTSIDLTDSSFVGRLIFFKDSLQIIARYPFGTGFLGYRALEGLYQTGNYTITFVHNGLLQLFMDAGWIPALMMAYVFLRCIFSGGTQPADRLLLIVILGHCMLDFDLQFFLFWVILLSVPDFETGREIRLNRSKRPLTLVLSCLLLVSTWLGIADYRYSTGRHQECLEIMPMHTDSMLKLLRAVANPEAATELADRVLELYPTCATAYSAKADAAFASGKVLDMIEYKKQAIYYARFTIREYLDYFRKLYSAMQTYLEAGDSVSAAYCANRLLEIPGMLEEAAKTLDPMDVQTIDKQVLTLPEDYLTLLEVLKENFS